LTPDKRLVFVLRDMFEVPFKEIALVAGALALRSSNSLAVRAPV
jgi:hypothetical protein